MKYTKPEIVAQNNAVGSYAAGCPTNKHFPGAGSCGACTSCEISN